MATTRTKATLADTTKGDTFVLAADGRKYERMGAQRADGRISIRDLDTRKLRHLAPGLAIKARRAAKA